MHDAGSKADVSPARRSRAAVTRENSAALRGAVVRCIAEAGWESLSVRKVSAAAGLSYGAIYTRVERLEDLVAETWSEVLWPILRDCLDVIIESYDYIVVTAAHFTVPFIRGLTPRESSWFL